MSFRARLRHIPPPFDPEIGKGDFPHFDNLDQTLFKFLTNVASTSPYLRRLIEHEGAWLHKALQQTPENAFDAVIASMEGADMRSLRRIKGRAALLLALCDIGGVWSLAEITSALTRFGECAVNEILNTLMQAEITAGAFERGGRDICPEKLGLFVIAMGKMGAHELNYSSDIDLVLFFDAGRFAPNDAGAVREVFLRVARKMVAILGKVTPEGYIFRTDLRLRPNPSVTPIVISTNAAEQYYESEGRNWERAAFIKARVIAGDLERGRAFLERLSPFIWRKYLDFAAIESTHEIRQSIRASRTQSTLDNLYDFNIKLGPGGIREIEFFAQTRQLIFGGRDKSLRVRATCEALDALVKAGRLERPLATMLQENYRFLRGVEHRLQMLYDAQTHSLPQTPEGFERLACLSGMDAESLKAKLHRTLREVHEEIEGFFVRIMPHKETFSATHSEILERWNGYPALRTQSAATILKRIAPRIFKSLDQSPAKGEAHRNFDHFMRSLPAGVQVFSLFEANPNLIELVVEICSISSSLADYLAHNHTIFDAVVVGDMFGALPDYSALRSELASQLEQENDYETILDTVRVWQCERHFQIGVNILKGYISSQEAARHYCALARVVLELLWPIVRAYSDAKMRLNITDTEFAILGMGSLGRGAINPRSDLDIILIYRTKFQKPPSSDLRQYASRVTRALIAALSAPTAKGRLYEVDMRLRPSGTKGPIAISWEAYQHYNAKEAWLWEHLALCSTQAIAGDATFCADFERYRRALLEQARPREKAIREMQGMRERLLGEAPHFDPEAPKAGAGGIRDIIYAAQLATYLGQSVETEIGAQIQAGVEIGLWQEGDAKALEGAFSLYQTLTHLHHLSERKWGESSHNALYLQATGVKEQGALAAKIGAAQMQAKAIIERLFAGG